MEGDDVQIITQNDENIDMNHSEPLTDDEEDENITNENTFDEPFKIGDMFIIITEEDDFKEDSLMTIQEVNIEEKKIYLKDENENDFFFSLDDNNNIILKTNEYSIFEIEKVDEFDIDELDNVDLMITKNIFPEIELDIIETKEKIFTYQERKENLITELISLYNAYNNEPLIYQISDISNHFLKMLKEDDKIYDYSETLPFIKDIIHKKRFNLPSWILPIVDNRKFLYKDPETDTFEENDDTIIKDFEEELKIKHESFTKYDEYNPNTYKSVIALNDGYKPFQNKNLVSIPYDGYYLRNCHESSPCNGILNQFVVDGNKTKKPLEIPVFKDKKTSFETLTPKENLSIAGFYTIPHTILNMTITEKNDLSLHELYYLSDKKYSYIPFSSRFRQSKIIPHIMAKDTMKIKGEWNEKSKEWGPSIHSYLFNENLSYDDLGKVLKNNLPDFNDLINVLPKNVRKNILNYSDFKKIFLSYDINYHILDENNRSIVNDLIKDNIKNYIQDYNRSVKRKKIVRKEKKIKKLSIEEKIKLSKGYILSLYVIPLRNFYLVKFIENFSREPDTGEDKNYFYEKNSDNKLLCKHYQFTSKIHKDKNIFGTMKSIFGTEPKDGIISCKVCGEYLCPENLSDLEGFSDGTPTNSREVLDTGEEINALSEKQLSIKKHIQKISGMLGVTLSNYDRQKIIDFYETIDDTSVVDYRYQKTNAFSKHPTMIEIKEKYKPIRPAKTKEEKKQNIKNAENLKNEGTIFKEYLVDCNELLITTFLILFFIQTAIPPYQLNTNLNLNLWDSFDNMSWENVKHTIHNNISMTTVDVIFKLLQMIVDKNKKDPFWKNANTFIKEQFVNEELLSFNEHFMMISSYILKNSFIKNKLKDYFYVKNNIQQSIYLNEYWPSYKPLYDNKLVQNINEKINNEDKKELLRNGSTIRYENISSIQSIDVAYVTPRYETLEIPYSDIIKNESYERLFNYSVHLHGKSGEIEIINKLILQFINTIPDSEAIEQIIEPIGWDTFTKQLKEINYKEFKKVFIVDLTEYFKSKNPDDADTIDKYIHTKFNNWNGMLLNGHSKRNYMYDQPIIFPNQSFEDLIETKMMDTLFDKFCIDEDDDSISEKVDNDNFIFNIIPDPDIERISSCSTKIPKTIEYFNRILEYKRSKTKLPLVDITNNQDENRVSGFIKKNNLLDFDADEAFSIFQTLSNDETSDYSQTFNDILQYNESIIEKIQTFFNKMVDDKIINDDQIRRFKVNFGRNIDSIEILLSKFLEDNSNIHNMIHNMYFTISRLSNIPFDPLNIESTGLLGTIFSKTSIPQQWKMSDTNTENMKDFLNKNENLLHNDVFIIDKNKRYEGFKTYEKEPKQSLSFKGLLNHMKKYYKKDIFDLVKNDNTITEEYSSIFNQFMFLYLFNKIITYIEDLGDELSPSSVEANILFLTLEEQDRLELDDSIRLCSQFSFDLLVHYLEEFFDPSWINQSDLLSDKLSKQKEREKQKLIDDLESKTGDARLVTLELQNAGITNWFGNAAVGNLEYLNSETRTNQLDDERINKIKELLSQNEEQLEVLEGNEINTDHLAIPQMIQEDNMLEEEGYNQYDMDREDEGLDDNDDDGNYRED